jgi:cystathionine beta-lyase/cystathionine gamma-synthase
MNSPFSIADHLPGLQREQPASAWIHTTSVTGPYGITASVKDFDEVLDWQEHRRELTRGYYRLIHPPQVQAFKARLEKKYPGFHAVLYTSGPLAAKEIQDLLCIRQRSTELTVCQNLPETLAPGRIYVLAFQQAGCTAGVGLTADADLAADLHERNRRRGGSLSARNVDFFLEADDGLFDVPDCKSLCANHLLEMEEAGSVHFYPSGMGAVTAVLDIVLSPTQSRMLVLGNVYRDTHLLLEEQRWAGKNVQTDFLDTHDLAGLQARIADPALAGVLIETITNPLIEIPDLPAIADICRQAGKPLLVDSTMAGPLNACPLDLGATVVMHSTSKYLSGSNVHGGGIVLTRDADWMQALSDQQVRWENRLSPLEFPALLEGLDSYAERIARFNANGEALAACLRAHPAVETVYYGNQGRPDWLKGLGSVVSCELKAPSLSKVATFFDAELPGVIKAPSLGSNQTLFCPYVLLAYYDKSDDYLRECNLSKTLLRFAAGCEEDFSGVLNGIRAALDLV